MAVTKTKKSAIITAINDNLQKAQSVALIDTKTYSVAEISTLRDKLYAADAKCQIIKKTLITLAIKQALNLEMDVKALNGNIALVFSFSDPISGPKITKETIKTLGKGAIHAGIFEGRTLSCAEINTLADILSREELLAKLLSSLNAPVSGLYGVCHGLLSSFVRTLDAVRAQKA